MNTPIGKRKVFYICGFDPRGASHYHRLYKTHGAAQSKVNGLRLEVSGRKRRSADSQGWRIRSEDAAGHGATETDMEFLVWDDIIRRQWTSRPAQVLADLGFCVRAYLLSGLIARFAAASRQQLIAGLYPPVYILLSLCAAGLAGFAAFSVGSSVALRVLPPPWEAVAGALLAALAAGLVLRYAVALGNRLAAFWLLRIYAFSARWARGQLHEIEARIDTFAERIAEALADPETGEEVLVVAHSVGTMLAVPALARALRDPRVERALAPGRLVLVTLGECIPLLSFQPAAEQFRRELQAVANDPRLLWLDYTAPTDGACFPLLDVVAASGLQTLPGRGPKLLSPRFFKLYGPQRYRRLRRDWYSMHFLYLMSTELPGDYDYFAITAGPQSLHARFAGV